MSDEIEYKGVKYPIRELFLDKLKGWRTVAQIELEEALFTKTHRYRDKLAGDIDDTIWYYCDKDEWKMDNKTLIKIITKGYGINE